MTEKEWMDQNEIDVLKEQLAAARAELETRSEQLQVQLAGCGVAALQNTRQSIAEQRIGRDVYGFSSSYEEVCNAVDREIEWRERAERAEAELVATRAEREHFKNCISAREVRAMVDERNKAWSNLADARVLLKEANEMLAEAIVCGPKLREYMPLRERICAALAGEKK